MTRPEDLGQYVPAGAAPPRVPYIARIGPVLRHGNGIVQPQVERGAECLVPFSLPGELVDTLPVGNGDECRLERILEPSAERVAPGCPHFGVCGGCQIQMASADEQLRIKRDVLQDWLMRAGVRDLPEIQGHVGEPWQYRNRIRLRVGRDEAGALRLGYNRRASREFLPIRTCPISAPLLWRAAEALLAAAVESPELKAWLDSAAEIELFADNGLARVQLSLLLERPPAPSTARMWTETWTRAMDALHRHIPELAGAGAVLLGPPQRERTRTHLAGWGATGLAYRVGEEQYWITRGGFFQVNRFLLPELVGLVCDGRRGVAAWDLFAGVGLFARVLTRSFAQVTAVEGGAVAARDLRAALRKCGPQHRAVQASTFDFLRDAVLQRERPDLITLDPPRVGVGAPTCELLLRLRAPEMVYVSCDPETLARDLAVLQRGFRVAALHLTDLFPQTFHQETVVALQRRTA